MNRVVVIIFIICIGISSLWNCGRLRKRNKLQALDTLILSFEEETLWQWIKVPARSRRVVYVIKRETLVLTRTETLRIPLAQIPVRVDTVTVGKNGDKLLIPIVIPTNIVYQVQIGTFKAYDNAKRAYEQASKFAPAYLYERNGMYFVRIFECKDLVDAIRKNYLARKKGYKDAFIVKIEQ